MNEIFLTTLFHAEWGALLCSSPLELNRNIEQQHSYRLGKIVCNVKAAQLKYRLTKTQYDRWTNMLTLGYVTCKSEIHFI